MKIRHKLTLLFSFIMTIIIVLFAYTILFFSTEYRKNEFNNRLRQRIEITEKIFLEKDNFSPDEYTKIQQQFLNKLPEETEKVVLNDSVSKEKLSYEYPSEFLENLLQNKEAYFQEGQRQGAGKEFNVGNHRYLVLLTGKDHIGIQMMDHLRTITFIVMAICIFIVSIASYLVSSYLLTPISKKIRKANSISVSNLHERLDGYDPDDEMGELAIAFNNLLDRVSQAFETQKLFIDNASHEIRNPLTAIMGETDVALEKIRSVEEYIESLKSIAVEADRLNTLLNDLLQLSNVSRKNVNFSRDLINVRELVIQAKAKLDFTSPENNIRLKFESTDSTSIIEGNQHLLETALINLMDNATKFSNHQEVVVNVSTPHQGRIRISIKDHGVGIPKEDLRKIFQPFHRASNVRHIKGTGIGIPLTSKIIELHHGEITITSDVNEGTIVDIILHTAM